jgi:hypothetical protein
MSVKRIYSVLFWQSLDEPGAEFCTVVVVTPRAGAIGGKRRAHLRRPTAPGGVHHRL